MDSGSLGSTLNPVKVIYPGDSDTVLLTTVSNGIASGERYRFITVATNDQGDSPASEEVLFTASTLPQQPAQLMRSSSSTRTQITLTWAIEPNTGDSPITGYAVEMDSTGEGTFVEIWNGRGRPDVLTYTVTVQTNQMYYFRHRAYNYNGVSPYSEVLSIYSCVAPTAPGKPTWVTSTTTTITLIWDSPLDNGGCPITQYKVYRDTGSGDQVINEVHSSDLSGKPFVNGLIVSEFPASPTPLGLSFVFKVRVFTLFSTSGVDSQESEAMLLAGVPAKPSAGPTRLDATSNTQISVSINAVTTTNGSPITSYHIDIDNGMGGSYTEIQGYTSNSLALTATKALGIYQGLYYRVRYRAKNAIGWGDYSDVTYVLSARVADTPIPPTVSITGTNALVTFYLPFNGGSDLTKAYLEFKDHASTSYFADTSNCDGTNAVTFQARTCTLPLTVLRGPSWSLVQGDLIVARVKFENEIGESAWSADTVAPPAMPYPPHLPADAPYRANAVTTGTTLGVYFDELTGLATGGQPILSYCLELSSIAGGTGTYTEVGGCTSDSLQTQYTITGLVSGDTYYLRYKARNAQGFSSLPSASREILLASRPQAIASAATTANVEY